MDAQKNSASTGAWLRITQSSKIVTYVPAVGAPSAFRLCDGSYLLALRASPNNLRDSHIPKSSHWNHCRARFLGDNVLKNSPRQLDSNNCWAKRLNPAHVPCQWVNNPTLSVFCGARLGRADIEGSKSDVAMNAWPPQASSLLPTHLPGHFLLEIKRATTRLRVC